MGYVLYPQGGDPLDFRPGNAASLSVHSTSLTDHYPEQHGTRYNYLLFHVYVVY